MSDFPLKSLSRSNVAILAEYFTTERRKDKREWNCPLGVLQSPPDCDTIRGGIYCNFAIMSKKTAGAVSSPEQTKEKEKTTEPTNPDSPRRDFLKVSVAAGIGACAVGAPVCAAVRLVTAPVFANGMGGKFYPITTLASLTEKPQKFTIVDDKTDAWMTLPQQKIGTLFLRKMGNAVQALHSLCPHAGCMIQAGNKPNPKTGTTEELFYCPCHAAFFDLDGKRLDTVAPRDMDSLEVKVEGERVFVKFENFTFGLADKKN